MSKIIYVKLWFCNLNSVCASWMPKTLHNSPPQEIVVTVDLSFNAVYHFYIFSYFDKRGIRNNVVHLSGMDVWETQKGGNELKKLRKCK